jgi:hypothetical protein
MPEFRNPVFHQELERIPTLEELDGVRGREIAGIEPVQERFTRLKNGEDFTVVRNNPNVVCSRDVSDFFVFINPSQGDTVMTVTAPHWRTVTEPGIQASMALPDNRGGGQEREYFYAANTKGVGYVKPSAKHLPFDNYVKWDIQDESGEHDEGRKVLGLSSAHDYAKGDIMQKSTNLLEQGLRTEAYWGVAEMKRLCYQGQKVEISALKRKGVIPKEKTYQPYQAVRLLKTNGRIAEAAEAPERGPQLFGEAFEVFNKEIRDKKLQIPEITLGEAHSEKRYFLEFFRRMGSNMAVLLNVGFSHFRIHSANVTLAAEIGDIGTMGPWDAEDKIDFTKDYNGVPRTYLKDMRDIAYDLSILLKAGKKNNMATGERESLVQAYMEGFDQSYKPSAVESHRVNPQNAKRWAEKIITTVIKDGVKLAPLQSRQVEEWGITI